MRSTGTQATTAEKGCTIVNKEAIGYGYRSVYTVNEFCDEHRVSRTLLYGLIKAGKGPRLMKLGRRTLISAEAANDWRRQVESTTANGGAE